MIRNLRKMSAMKFQYLNLKILSWHTRGRWKYTLIYKAHLYIKLVNSVCLTRCTAGQGGMDRLNFLYENMPELLFTIQFIFITQFYILLQCLSWLLISNFVVILASFGILFQILGTPYSFEFLMWANPLRYARLWIVYPSDKVCGKAFQQRLWERFPTSFVGTSA